MSIFPHHSDRRRRCTAPSAIRYPPHKTEPSPGTQSAGHACVIQSPRCVGQREGEGAVGEAWGMARVMQPHGVLLLRGSTCWWWYPPSCSAHSTSCLKLLLNRLVQWLAGDG